MPTTRLFPTFKFVVVAAEPVAEVNVSVEMFALVAKRSVAVAPVHTPLVA